MIHGLSTPNGQGGGSALIPYQPGILTGGDAHVDHARMQLAQRTIEAQIMGGPMNGQTMQLALHPQDVHISEELATYIAGYSPARYLADVAAPMVDNVPQMFDQYRVFTTANAFQQANVLASTQSPVNAL